MSKKLFKSYKFIKQIGKGASSRVYEIRDANNRGYALKEIGICDKESIECIFNEKSMPMFSHKNVLRYKCLFMSKRPSYITEIICDRSNESRPSSTIDYTPLINDIENDNAEDEEDESDEIGPSNITDNDPPVKDLEKDFVNVKKEEDIVLSKSTTNNLKSLNIKMTKMDKNEFRNLISSQSRLYNSFITGNSQSNDRYIVEKIDKNVLMEKDANIEKIKTSSVHLEKKKFQNKRCEMNHLTDNLKNKWSKTKKSKTQDFMSLIRKMSRMQMKTLTLFNNSTYLILKNNNNKLSKNDQISEKFLMYFIKKDEEIFQASKRYNVSGKILRKSENDNNTNFIVFKNINFFHKKLKLLCQGVKSILNTNDNRNESIIQQRNSYNAENMKHKNEIDNEIEIYDLSKSIKDKHYYYMITELCSFSLRDFIDMRNEILYNYENMDDDEKLTRIRKQYFKRTYTEKTISLINEENESVDIEDVINVFKVNTCKNNCNKLNNVEFNTQCPFYNICDKENNQNLDFSESNNENFENDEDEKNDDLFGYSMTIEDKFGLLKQIPYKFFKRIFDKENSNNFYRNIWRCVVEGLNHLHSKNIYHNDLTCSNVFFNSFFIPKIGDFGMTFNTLKQENADDKSKIFLNNCSNTGLKTDLKNIGLIFFEMLWPMKTCMERAKTMELLSEENKFPDEFIAANPKEFKIIKLCIENKIENDLDVLALLKMLDCI